MADLMWFVASGQKIDPERTPKFIGQIEKLFANPFEKPKVKTDFRSAAEIKEHIRNRIRKLRGVKKDGSAAAGRED